MRKTDEIGRKVLEGERLSRDEGVTLLRDGDFLELGQLADAVRWRKHPEPVVTYIIDRNINYTNVCTAQCAFCAFYRDMPSKEGYVLSQEELAQKIEETIALGGRQILLQGGRTPTSASSTTRSCSAGSRPATRSGSTVFRRPRSSTSRACRSCRSRPRCGG